MLLADDKAALRKAAMARRAGLAVAVPDAAERVARHFLEKVELSSSAPVAVFFSMGDELDTTPIIRGLRARGIGVALPRVAGKGLPLAFHLYPEGARLLPAPFGLSEPGADWPEAEPDILAVPLLAFDARGYRLGYGGGFYDRTLAALRARRPILAIGYAYAGQEVEQVPHDLYDQRLDAIVTESGMRKFGL